MRRLCSLFAILLFSWQLTAVAAENCLSGLNAKDKNEMHALDDELAESDLSTEEVSAILQKHETNLSLAAQQALLANLDLQSFASMISELETNPKLSAAYLQFKNEVEAFVKNRERFLGGVRNIDADDKALNAAQKEFVTQIEASSLDEGVKVALQRQMDETLISVYSLASQRANVAAGQEAIAGAATGTFLAADMIVLSFLTAGVTADAAAGATALAGSEIAGSITSTTLTAVAGAAAGGGAVGLTGIGSMALNAAVDSNENQGFFCSLAQNVENNGQAALHQAIVYALISGVSGGVLKVGMAYLPKTAALITAFTIGKAGQGLRALRAVKEGSVTYELVKQAHEAEAAGDETKAQALIAQAKEAAVETGMDVVATIFLSWLSPARSRFTAKVTGKPTQPQMTFKQLLEMGWARMQRPSAASA